MSKPIYKLWLMKNTPKLHQAMREDPERAGKVMAEFAQAQKELGIERLITCESLWANEEFFGFGVEKYPDVEALEKNIQKERELGLFEYFEAFTLLGFEQEG